MPTSLAALRRASARSASRVRAALRRGRGAVRAHRAAAACASLVAVVAAVCLALAWATWQATSDAREVALREGYTVSDNLETSLTADQTHDLRGSLERDTAAQATRHDTTRDAAADRSTSGSRPEGSSTTGGWIMSTAAVAAVLLAGLAAAFQVVRRYRKGSADDPTDVAVVDDAGRDAGAEEQDEEAVDPIAEPTATSGEWTDSEQAGVESESAGAVVRDQAVAAPAQRSGSSSDDATAWQRSGSSSDDATAWQRTGVPQQALADALRLAPVPLATGTAERHEAPSPSYAPTERLYERRTAPRVDYVQRGELVWRDVTSQVTVLDLSSSGLRCTVDRPSAPPFPPVPAATDYVRVTFPVEDGPLTIKARVAWRRNESGSTQLGLQFLPIPYADEQRLLATCYAAA
jgi:hypothetical protein